MSSLGSSVDISSSSYVDRAAPALGVSTTSDESMQSTENVGRSIVKHTSARRASSERAYGKPSGGDLPSIPPSPTKRRAIEAQVPVGSDMRDELRASQQRAKWSEKQVEHVVGIAITAEHRQHEVQVAAAREIEMTRAQALADRRSMAANMSEAYQAEQSVALRAGEIALHERAACQGLVHKLDAARLNASEEHEAHRYMLELLKQLD